MPRRIEKNKLDYRSITARDYDPEEFGAYVRFHDVVHENELGQTQYAAHYVEGLAGAPRIAQDLRIIEESKFGTFYTWLIHKDDANIFAERYRELHKDC